MMKFAVLLAVASTVVAQSASIGAPKDGSSVKTGSDMNVMIEQPNSLSSSQQVAIVIGLALCTDGPTSCPGANNELGTILYNGTFNPQYATPPGSLPPHQNFTVKVPETFSGGYAQLGVAHFSLIGAGLSPHLETFNSTLKIEGGTSGTSSSAGSSGASSGTSSSDASSSSSTSSSEKRSAKFARLVGYEY